MRNSPTDHSASKWYARALGFAQLRAARAAGAAVHEKGRNRLLAVRPSCRQLSRQPGVSLLHALVVRIGERFLDRRRLREIQVDVLGRNRAGEPLGVDLVDVA